MGCVLITLVYLYVSAGVSLIGAWRTSSRDRGKVLALEHQHIALRQEHSALRTRSFAETEARRLGMAHPGEKVYVIRGLPRD